MSGVAEKLRGSLEGYLARSAAELDRAFDRVLVELCVRADKLAAETKELEDRLRALAGREAEVTERERMFTEKSDRLRVEQRRLADRERELAEFQRDLLDPDAALSTQWVAKRDRSFADAESLLDERS